MQFATVDNANSSVTAGNVSYDKNGINAGSLSGAMYNLAVIH